MVAINVDTGKMVWYYQTSPHDTHDWDSAQTPVLVDGDFNGSGPRKMVLTASRNGYYFTLDRVTGEHLVTSTFSDTVNWAKPALNAKGQPVRDPAKDFTSAARWCRRPTAASTNWPPPAYSPTPACSTCRTSETYAMYYLTETDPRGAMGLGGKDEVSVGTMGSFISAIDYKTGKIASGSTSIRGRRPRGANGLLTTAGKLLFGGDVSRQPRRLRSGQRQAALALADRPGDERAGDVHARRPPAHAGRRRRHALLVHAVPVARWRLGARRL